MAQYCINSCRGQQSHNYLSALHIVKILNAQFENISQLSDLEVVPDICHAALYKRLSGLLLYRRPSNVQSVHISQVVNAANIHPVP